MIRQFSTILENHSVASFDSVGQPFDPNRHEAISREETSEVEPNVVLSEMHRGYLLHDRLLRPALVVVSCAPAGGWYFDYECDLDCPLPDPEPEPDPGSMEAASEGAKDPGDDETDETPDD